MSIESAIGRRFNIHRPDSEGFGKVGRCVAIDARLPFPVAVVWDEAAPESGWSFFLPIELEPAAIQ